MNNAKHALHEDNSEFFRIESRLDDSARNNHQSLQKTEESKIKASAQKLHGAAMHARTFTGEKQMTNKKKMRGSATMGMMLVLMLPFTLPKCDNDCYCCANHDGEQYCDDSGGQLCERVDSCQDGGCGGECDSTPDGLSLSLSSLDSNTARNLIAIANNERFEVFQLGEAVVEPVSYEELSNLNTPQRMEWLIGRGLVPARITIGQLSTHIAVRLSMTGDSIQLKGWAPGADQELASLEAQQSLADYQTLTGSITTGIALLR